MILTDSLLIIDDCYNANPVSTKASIDVLSGAETRKVAILGDMFELGEDEKELHRQVGVHASEKGSILSSVSVNYQKQPQPEQRNSPPEIK